MTLIDTIDTKSTKGGVPGVIPTKLAIKFGPKIGRQAAQIFGTITSTGQWPKRWRIEQGLALKKLPEPKSEDELRIIFLTPFVSKTYEKFVVEGL